MKNRASFRNLERMIKIFPRKRSFRRWHFRRCRRSTRGRAEDPVFITEVQVELDVVVDVAGVLEVVPSGLLAVALVVVAAVVLVDIFDSKKNTMHYFNDVAGEAC